jgi:hypothetical protein
MHPLHKGRLLLDSENLAERATSDRVCSLYVEFVWQRNLGRFTEGRKRLRLLVSIESDEVGPNWLDAKLTKHRHYLTAMVG